MRTCCATSSAFPRRRSKNAIGTRRSFAILCLKQNGDSSVRQRLVRLLASFIARTSVEEVHRRGLGEHRLGNAVARGAAALLGALCRLQIGAKVARAFDD